MTEKEILLYMVKNTKKNMPTFCYGIKCLDCYYLVDKYKFQRGINGFCGSPFRLNMNKNKNPEQYYIEKFGYVSLIEESL